MTTSRKEKTCAIPTRRSGTAGPLHRTSHRRGVNPRSNSASIAAGRDTGSVPALSPGTLMRGKKETKRQTWVAFSPTGRKVHTGAIVAGWLAIFSIQAILPALPPAHLTPKTDPRRIFLNEPLDRSCSKPSRMDFDEGSRTAH
jgi:hypothetical protein